MRVLLKIALSKRSTVSSSCVCVCVCARLYVYIFCTYRMVRQTGGYGDNNLLHMAGMGLLGTGMTGIIAGLPNFAHLILFFSCSTRP